MNCRFGDHVVLLIGCRPRLECGTADRIPSVHRRLKNSKSIARMIAGQLQFHSSNAQRTAGSAPAVVGNIADRQMTGTFSRPDVPTLFNQGEGKKMEGMIRPLKNKTEGIFRFVRSGFFFMGISNFFAYILWVFPP
jgi:hypothetical protein